MRSEPGDEDRTRDAGDAVPALHHYIPEGVLHDGSAILDRFLAWVAARGIQPYPAQEEALLELMTGRHVILSTPTGSGKTLVAEGLHFKAMCEGHRSFYTAPIKALASEKFFALCDAFGAENVGMLTGDASMNWAAPIICCTAEVLANMSLDGGADTDAPYVIMDEFHYYSDRERGSAWQIPLIALPRTRFLLMSATLGDTRSIEQALFARTGQTVARVHSDERPVPLDWSYVETPIHETVEGLLASDRAPVYIVHFTQREAAEQAQSLTSANVSDKLQRRAISEAIGGFRFDSPYGRDVKRILSHGIGLHHAGLLPKYRLLVERLAQQGLLRVICGTDTLGVGVNVPIRTVLFTKLCKFDGEKVGLLSVRDFKQISGRAGRKGFDERGSVVVQAPEHVIENKRIEAKMRGASPGARKKLVKKKPPTRGFVPWNEDTLDRLVTSPPETLVSRFRVNHGLIISCLKSRADDLGGGYRAIVSLIDASHEDAARKRVLRREAARLFRSLRSAEIVALERRANEPPRLRISDALQDDFSLHHTLSLYLVEAAGHLDPGSPDFALDLLSLTEAILEDPRAILIAQERKAKSELVAQLKAERVPYEERMQKLEQVTWPKPNAEFIYATFAMFAEKHPWVAGGGNRGGEGKDQNIRPKGVARALYEDASDFRDFVKRMELGRLEGALLRYLAQVHDTLARSVPERLRDEETEEMIGYLRAMIASVDTSLLEAWERLVAPAAPAEREAEPARPAYDLANDPPALRARIRGELQALVRDLANRRYADAVTRLHPDTRLDAEALEAALAPFYAEHERIVYDPRARQAHRCVISEARPRVYRFAQGLIDEADENTWSLFGQVDLCDEPNPAHPLIRLERVSE